MNLGTAAADFTPAPGLILQGHLSENRSHGVLYPLEARAAVLRSGESAVCLITLDVIGVEPETTRRIRAAVSAATRIPQSNITIFASHTHCAPAMLRNLAMTPEESFVASVESAAVRCASEAAAGAIPVTMGLGAGSAYFNVNRRPLPGEQQMHVNFAGVVDHRARFCLFESDGRPALVLFTFSCHPTTKPGSEGFISSDYPGIARSEIEAALGCRAMFLPGCFGNIRPQIGGQFVPASKEQLERVGGELAAAIVGGAPFVRTHPFSRLAAREGALCLGFAEGKPTAELESMARQSDTLGNRVRADWARRLLARRAANQQQPGPVSIMQSIDIGPLTLITVPGEAVQEIGYAIEALAPGRNVWALGYTNDQLGYLVTERHKREGGYEPNAYTFYDRPGPYDNEEGGVVGVARGLLGE